MATMEIQTSGLSNFMQFIGVLFIFLFVLAATYFTTKWMAGYQKVRHPGRNLRIVETMRLNQNNYIQIIQAGEVYLVIGVGKDEVTMLTTIDKDQLQDPEACENANQAGTGESFQEILGKLKGRLPKK